MTIVTYAFTGTNGATFDTTGPFTQLGSGWTGAAQIQGNALAGIEGDAPVWGIDTGDDEHFAEMVWYEEAVWEPGQTFRLWVAVTNRNQGLFAAYDASDGWGLYKSGTGAGRLGVAASNAKVDGATMRLEKRFFGTNLYDYVLKENATTIVTVSALNDPELNAVTWCGFSCQATQPGDSPTVSPAADDWRSGTIADLAGSGGGGTARPLVGGGLVGRRGLVGAAP